VVVNVDAAELAGGDGDAGAECALDGGPALPVETARRIACDAEVVGLVLDADRQVVGIGRASRRPPRWLRRRVHARDRGCRYPGCAERRVVSPHHVWHWTRGGPTDLDNLVELCRFHHRLVHEGGWTMTFDGGAATFTSPAGRVVGDAPVDLAGDGGGSAEPLEEANAHRGVVVDPDAVMPGHHDRLDLDLALTVLLRPGDADRLAPR
jgi:hypothetical protein